MPGSWIRALDDYHYPFDLSKYDDASRYPGWFIRSSDHGDRADTIQMEEHFRRHAADAIEPWLEVVYWKIYNQPLARNKITHEVSSRLLQNQISPRDLWDACNRFVQEPIRHNFEAFRGLLVVGKTIAVAATFPAFVRPDLYPMVDRRVAKWVASYLAEHNSLDPNAPRLIAPVTPVLSNSKAVLTVQDFTFYEVWVRWCQYKAQKLGALTQQIWRARDVEMAVFSVWGKQADKRAKGPLIHLSSLDFIGNRVNLLHAYL